MCSRIVRGSEGIYEASGFNALIARFDAVEYEFAGN